MRNSYRSFKQISGLAVIILITLISGCKDRSVGVVGNCPVVSETSPANSATDVELDKVITVTFEEEINPATMMQEAFSLTSSSGEVTGSMSFNEETHTMSFVPDVPLASGTVYTGTVENTIEDPLGNQMLEDYEWSFTTEETDPSIPVIVSTFPANAATGIAIDTEVRVTFNMPMDPSSISDATFTLADGETAVDGTVEYEDSEATFTPASELGTGTTYTATVTTGAESEEGVALQEDFTWTFTTETGEGLQAPIVDSTDPTDGETDVALNKIVSATFTSETNPNDLDLSLFTITFTLHDGSTEIDGSVTYDDLTAYFEPDEDLDPGTTYDAKITATVVDDEGNEADREEHEWSFTTASTEGLQAPIVDFTDPTDGETGVNLDKVISATFTSETDPQDLELALFTVSFVINDGESEIEGSVTYDNLTAYFEPDEELEEGTIYNAKVITSVKGVDNDFDTEEYEWTFATSGLQAPIVDFTDPTDGETGVDLDKVISATFTSETNPQNLDLSLFTVSFTINDGESEIEGTVTYDNLTAYFEPDEELEDGTIYNAKVTTTVKGEDNNTDTEEYEWTFATNGLQAPIVDFTDPTDGETGVVLDKVISATFTSETNPYNLDLSLFTVTYTVHDGDSEIGGVVYYDDLTAYFEPDEELQSGTVYTTTVTTSVTGTTGEVDMEEYTWSFTTQTE